MPSADAAPAGDAHRHLHLRWEENKGLQGEPQIKDANPDQLTARDL